jgi:hypothetical protein
MTLLNPKIRSYSLNIGHENKDEDEVLWKIFEPKTNEGSGQLRLLYSEELRYICRQFGVMMVKFRRLKWTGRVARIGRQDIFIILVVKLLRE